MNKPFIYIPALLALGIVIGIYVVPVRDDAEMAGADDLVIDTDGSQQALNNENDTGSTHLLENKVAELEERVLQLEQALDAKAENKSHTETNTRALSTNPRFSQVNRTLTIESLVRAGISEQIASEIVRRRNDLELRKLKLRDLATREGYVDTDRYTDELAALLAKQTTLREDLGDEAYDRYLFANKRTNRVKAASVMVGSAAEQAGMKNGDIILNYGEFRVFDWRELKSETGKGELGEYVNVDILRDGQLMSLWMPRGPLGVRLGVARVEP